MTDQHQTRTSKSAPADAIDTVIGERPNASSAHMNRSVSNGQPASVVATTPKADHTIQAKENKPPKINGKYASVALVIELQLILLQWIVFKNMKNMPELTRNIRRKLDRLSRTLDSHYFDKRGKDNTKIQKRNHLCTVH